jgi:hypothetical protein
MNDPEKVPAEALPRERDGLGSEGIFVCISPFREMFIHGEPSEARFVVYDLNLEKFNVQQLLCVGLRQPVQPAHWPLRRLAA